MSSIIEISNGEVVSVCEDAPKFPVVFHDHPFSSYAKVFYATDGQLVSKLISGANLPADYLNFISVWIDDEKIEPNLWDQTIVRAGSTLYMKVVPQKSGKDILRSIAMIVIAVVAWYVAPYLFSGGAMGTAGWAAVGSSLTLTTATALVMAGITMIGYMALNAIIPPPGLKKDEQRYSLTGTSNTFAPFANIPRILGKRRMFPMVAARPYSEIQGDDEYLRICLLVGWGPVKITDIKIGETPIAAFDGVEIETREGWSTDAPLTLFTRTVTEDSFSYALEPFGYTGGYYLTGTYGYLGNFYQYNSTTNTVAAVTPTYTNGWASRTTAANAVEFSVDVAFPSGLFYFDSKGNKKEATVQIDVQYRAVGATTWIDANWVNTTDQGFGTAGRIVATAAEQTAIRRSGRVKLPSAGQYEVQMRRVTVNSGDKYVDMCWWTTLRTIKADYPVNEKNLALIALRIKATKQLNGVPQTINCLAESYLPTTDLTQNLNTNSATLANWNKSQAGMVITSDNVLGHFGTTTMDSVSNAVSLASYVSLACTYTAGTTYTRSFYGKAISGTGIIVSEVGAGVTSTASFNLLTGVATIGGGGSCYMVAGNNGTYRCIHTFTVSATPTNNIVLYIGAYGTTATATTVAIEGVQTEEASSVGTYTGTTTTIKPLWSYTLTSNPAWAYCDLLRRRAGKTYLADNRIDLSAIYAWAQACDATAPNASESRWTFNSVLEGGSLFENLRLVASNSRSSYTMRDGKHSVVRDIQQTVPVQHITPRNSWAYSGTKVFIDYPHALRVMFINSANNYQQDERIVYYDGYDSTNATKFETLDLVGCTSPTQAWREARYHMAAARLRPEEHQVDMDIEALRCTLGDLVLFSHDAAAIGILATRVEGITLNVSNRVSAITLADEIYFEAAKTYVLRGRLSDGTSVLVSLTNPGAGYTKVVSPVTPPLPTACPAVGDLCVFGESTKETAMMMVKKIEPGDDFNVTVSMVNYDDGIYTADTTTIPAFNSYITLQSLPGAGTVPSVYISAIRSDDSVTLINLDGTITYRIFVQLQQPAGTMERISGFEVQFRRQNNSAWEMIALDRSTPFCYIDRVIPGEVYELRSRGVAPDGNASTWSSIFTHTVVGKTNSTALATGLTATAIPGGISLAWTDPTNDDLWQTEVYEGTVSTSASAVLIGTVSSNKFDRLGLSAASGIRYYWIKSVDTSGNKTAFVGPVSTTALNKAVFLVCTNEAIALPANSAGTVASFADATGLLKVYDGDVDVTASATLSATATNCTGSINTAANTPTASQPKGYYAVTALSANAGTLTLSAVYNGVTVTKVFSVSKALAGTNGSNGTNGSTTLGLVQNGNFENAAATPWTVDANSSVVTGNAFLGTYSLRIASLAGGPNATSAKWAVATGEIYKVTAYAKRDESALPNANAALAVRTYDSTGTLVAYNAIATANSATTGWQQLQGEFTVPSGVATIALDVGESGGTTGFWFFDECSAILKGSSGTNGVNAVNVNITKPSAVVMAYADGSVPSWTGIDGLLTVFDGATDVTASATLSATASGLTGTINTAANTPVAAQSKGYYQVTAMTGDTGTLTLTAVYNSVTYTRTFAVTKSKTGYEIVAALPVTNLFAGRMVFLTGDSKLYRYNGTAWTTAVSGADITAGTVTATAFASAIEPITVVTAVPGTKSTNSIFNTTDGFLYRWNGTSYVKTIPGSDISSGTLPAAAFASSIEPITIVSSVPGTKSTNSVFNTTDGKLYRWNGSAYVATVAAGDLTGTIATAQIANNAITATQIADNSISTAKIAANAVTAAQIAANTITAAQIAANTITASQIATDTITAGQIAAGAITASELAANAVVAGKIAAGTITAADIAANTITSSQIAANTISAGQIAAGAIGTSQLAANAVTAAKMVITSQGAALNSDPAFADSSAWAAFSGNATYTTITDGKVGNTVARSSGAGTQSWINGADRIPVDPNKTYRIRGWLRTVSGITSTAYLGVALYDSANANIAGDGSQWYYAASAVTPPATFTEYIGYFGAGTAKTIPATARTMTPLVILSYGGGTAIHEAQDVRIEEVLPSTLIQDGAITTAKVAANAITANQIAAGAITAGKIAAGAIVAADISAGTITGDRIAVGTIQSDRLSVTQLSSINANIGTVTSGVIQNSTGSAQFDLTNAKIIFNNGTYMKVTGIGFGASSNYLEWYGPTVSSASNFAACTDANAIYYLKTNGTAYFGGVTPSARTTKTYNTQVTSVTETAPLGVTKAIIEIWGASGAGGCSNFSGWTGGTGGTGAYARSTISISPGQTLIITTGPAGGAATGGGAGGAGGATTVAAGTATLTTMTAPGGGGGAAGTGNATALGGSAGSIATGGNEANSTGTAGFNAANTSVLLGPSGVNGYSQIGATGGTSIAFASGAGPGGVGIVVIRYF